MVTNPPDNVFIVRHFFCLKVNMWSILSIFERAPVLPIHLPDVIEPCENEISVTGRELPLLCSLQMTEGRLCQVQLLDDRKLELLVQV